MTTGVVAMQEENTSQSIFLLIIIPTTHTINDLIFKVSKQEVFQLPLISIYLNQKKFAAPSASLCNCYLLEQSCLIPLQMCKSLGAVHKHPPLHPMQL
jgi:hypothetical protein